MHVLRPIHQRRPAALLLVVLCSALALQTGACSLLTDVDEERPGAKLLKRSVARPAWASDGSAIYYTDRAGSLVTSFTINAIDVASGRTRKLATLTGFNTGSEQVRTTADPSVVYFAISNVDGSLQYTVYRVPSHGGAVDTLATNAGWPWFSISMSGNRLAYPGPRHGSDTVQVVTLSDSQPGAPVSIPAMAARPQVMGLSPDGATIVYHDSSEIYSVPADGGPHRVLLPSPASTSPDSARLVATQMMWHGATPHMLVATSSPANENRIVSIHDVDGGTGARTLIGTIAGSLSSPWTLSRSGDGRSFAAWVPVAVVNQNVERTTYRFRLYVQTPRTGVPNPVLEWTASEPLNWLEFSPDGRRLGFVLSGGLYVVGIDG